MKIAINCEIEIEDELIETLADLLRMDKEDVKERIKNTFENYVKQFNTVIKTFIDVLIKSPEDANLEKIYKEFFKAMYLQFLSRWSGWTE